MLLLPLLFLVGLTTARDPRGPPLCGTPFALTLENLDIYDGLLNGSITPGQGSSDLLFYRDKGGPREWPRNKENKVVIKYCFDESGVRDKVEKQFREQGIGEWIKALGGKASKESGHGLEFEETKDADGKPIYCFDTTTHKWDDRVASSTVVVSWNPSPHFAASGTIGYVAYGEYEKEQGIHQLDVGEDWQYPVLIHELGHVLGMAHEHQREDRDDHVEYRCHNVRDFKKIYEEVKKYSPDAPESALCDILANAVLFRFRGQEFVKGLSVGDPRGTVDKRTFWTVMDYGEPYDHDSVMHYYSKAHMEPGLQCGKGFEGGCTLAKILPDGGREYIPVPVKPSAGDVKWVKWTYPWMDPPAVANATTSAISNVTASATAIFNTTTTAIFDTTATAIFNTTATAIFNTTASASASASASV